MKRKIIILVIVTVVILGSIFLWNTYQFAEGVKNDSIKNETQIKKAEEQNNVITIDKDSLKNTSN